MIKRSLLHVLYWLQIAINLIKLFLYAWVALWLFLYLRTLDASDVDTPNQLLLQLSNAINSNILLITATIAILEFLSHFFSFKSIAKDYDEAIKKLDEYEEKQNQRRLKLMYKKDD